MEMVLLSVLSFVRIGSNSIDIGRGKIEFLERELFSRVFILLDLKKLVLWHGLSFEDYRAWLGIFRIL